MSRTVRRSRSIVALPALGAAGVAAALVVGAVHGPAADAGLVARVTTNNHTATNHTATNQTTANKLGPMWAAPAAPAVSADSDSNAVEVGAKFSTNTAGTVNGVRFYKGRTNTGVHVADLWDSLGNKLASATFTGETASGWQSVNFASPVAIVPGVKYVVSYHTTTGHYAEQEETFAGGATLSDGVVTETNGMYAYGSGGFPTQSWNNSSYYVQVAFAAGGVTTTPSTTPPTPSPTHSATPTPTTPAPSPSPSHSPSPSPSTPAPSPSPSHSPSPSPSTPAPSPSPSHSPLPSPSTNSPSPTSSASAPTGKTNCFAVPSACGYPDATNTGVPAGTTLTNSGGITLSTPGQVVTGLRVNGNVSITASNVTFKDSIVDGYITVSYGSLSGVLIDHVEVSGDGSDPGIQGAGFTANAVNVHGTGDGIDVQNNDVVTNSYIHGLVVPSGAHVDSLQTAGGNALLVDHNTLDSTCSGCNSAVIIGADLGAFTGQQLLENNLFAGGGYTAYAGTGGYNATNMISFVNNRFVNDAGYGPCSFNVPVAFTGNIMDNTGSSLSCSG